jgi:predicted RNase H-like HicB family nuclease
MATPMTETAHYPAQVFWDEDDKGFIALASDLPGCSAFGETQEEALRELQHAIVAWKQAGEKAGNPIPAPSKSPAPPQYSGKVLLRMAYTLHAELAAEAKAEGVSLNHLINTRLVEAKSRRSVEAVSLVSAEALSALVLKSHEQPGLEPLSGELFKIVLPAVHWGPEMPPRVCDYWGRQIDISGIVSKALLAAKPGSPDLLREPKGNKRKGGAPPSEKVKGR